MCTILGLGATATLALIFVGGGIAGVSAVKLFKLGLAKFKAKFFPTQTPPAA